MTAPVYDATTKAARMTATRDTVADGDLQILTSADAVLVTFALSTAGGTVATDTWTIQFDAGSGSSTVAATGTGTAAKARLRNSGGTTRITGITVDTSGTGVIVDNTSIASGQSVTISSATIQHAADPA